MFLKNLVVRTDATSKSGIGHLMRCMALAQVWRNQGGEVTFLSYFENVRLQHLIISEGFRLISMVRMHPDPSDLKQVLNFLRNGCKKNDLFWLILDGYHFDHNYQAVVRETGTKLLVIDDYNHLPLYQADILLNQNIGAEKISYANDPSTICLFGPKYALLRSEFLNWKERIKSRSQRVRNILVTMGGADPENITLKVIRALLQAELNDFEINIVVGPANPNIEMLKLEIARAAKEKMPIAKGMHLHESSNMPELMAEADLAISSGGTTCWELCFFRVPFIVIVAAENQRGVASGLDSAGAALSLGWHEDVEAVELASAVSKLTCDTDKLCSMSASGSRLVDGQGCARILNLIEWIETAAERKDIKMRKAGEEDTYQLWKLNSETGVRQNSFNPEPISYDKHVKWFKEKLESNSSVIYILDVSGVLLAQVRYDRKDEAAEIDYAVIPSFRGKKLGSRVLEMTWEMACRELDVKRVRGIVKEDNIASIFSFLRAGFIRTKSENYSGFNCVFFEKKLESKDNEQNIY